ncbi:MAG: hydrogenase maturation nickel metallochaperone HypA [Caldimicrobium sp.]
MHEYSLFLNILYHLEKILEPYSSPQLKKVIFVIGELSGVEEEFLKKVIETFKERTLLKDAEIIFEKERLKVFCTKCEKMYEPKNTNTQCPYCEGFETKIVGGMDFYIKSLEILVEESSENKSAEGGS